ncbi:MAG: ribose-phosphate pyrophosphokinase [Nanoarchaeota archaeon]|nr:ribose-phosphate pyrophosphokinase [Nanoarchaeota archaeon]
MQSDIQLITGTAHPELAGKIAKQLGMRLGKLELKRFANGETYARITETARGRDVFIIQPTCRPVNDNLMELLIIIDAMRRSSAGRIHAVIPWYGYSRQDRQAKSREPITAKLVANMLSAAGVDHVLTIDLHSGQTQGFFDVPVDHLYGLPVLAEYIKKKGLKDLVVVGPDVGASKKADKFSKTLGADIAIVHKSRPKPNQAIAHSIIGNVNGKNVVIIDDMIDTGGTIVEAVNLCKKEGAEDIYVCATHAVFSPPCVERMSKLPVKEIVVTDTFPLPEEKRFPSLVIISIAPLIAEAIKRIHEESSLTPLSDGNMT